MAPLCSYLYFVPPSPRPCAPTSDSQEARSTRCESRKSPHLMRVRLDFALCAFSFTLTCYAASGRSPPLFPSQTFCDFFCSFRLIPQAQETESATIDPDWGTGHRGIPRGFSCLCALSVCVSMPAYHPSEHVGLLPSFNGI